MESNEPRDPESIDLRKISRWVNDRRARYVVIWGMALVYHGLNLGTEDIDLLIKRTVDTIRRLKASLLILQDNAVAETNDGRLECRNFSL